MKKIRMILLFGLTVNVLAQEIPPPPLTPPIPIATNTPTNEKVPMNFSTNPLCNGLLLNPGYHSSEEKANSWDEQVTGMITSENNQSDYLELLTEYIKMVNESETREELLKNIFSLHNYHGLPGSITTNIEIWMGMVKLKRLNKKEFIRLAALLYDNDQVYGKNLDVGSFTMALKNDLLGKQRLKFTTSK